MVGTCAMADHRNMGATKKDFITIVGIHPFSGRRSPTVRIVAVHFHSTAQSLKSVKSEYLKRKGRLRFKLTKSSSDLT